MQRGGGRINFSFNDSFSSLTAKNDGSRKGQGGDPEEQINLKLKAQSRDGGSNVNYQGASADAAGHTRRVLWYPQRHQLNYLISTVVQA